MNGFVLVQPIDHRDAVSLSRVRGVTRVGGFGNNPDVDTGTLPEDAWTGGGRYPWLPVITALQMRSTSALDTVAGTGARTVSVACLGAPGLIRAFNQVVDMNGTAAVPIPIGIYRINLAQPASVGSDGINMGDIIIEDVAAPNTVRAIIPAGKGTTQQAAYTVPEGNTLLIRQIYTGIVPNSGSTTRSCTVSTWFRFTSGVTRTPITLHAANGQPYHHFADPPIAIPAGTDFSLLVTNLSNDNSDITAAWNGMIATN